MTTPTFTQTEVTTALLRRLDALTDTLGTYSDLLALTAPEEHLELVQAERLGNALTFLATEYRATRTQLATVLLPPEVAT